MSTSVSESAPTARHNPHTARLRTVLRIEGRELARRLARQLAAATHEREIRALRPVDAGFDVITDWPGDSGPGTFAIGGHPDEAEPFEHIEEDPTNDVAFPSERLRGKPFALRCQRGPAHPTSRFAVKAMPIHWLRTRPTQPDSAAVVTRDVDYRYQEGVVPERIDWQEADLDDGVRRVILYLQLGTDYEIWVRLQHPDGSDNWRIQDPVVITDTGGGGQGNNADE